MITLTVREKAQGREEEIEQIKSVLLATQSPNTKEKECTVSGRKYRLEIPQ